MSRPRHLSRLMVSPSVHVVYLFNHHRLSLRVLLRAGLDCASLLSTCSNDVPSGTTSFRNTPVLPIVSLRVKTLIRSLTMSELTPSSRATSDSLPTIEDLMCPSSVGRMRLSLFVHPGLLMPRLRSSMLAVPPNL